MTTPDAIRYTWTTLDRTITDRLRAKAPCAGTPQCVSSNGVHVCHVTPFGLLPAAVDGCSTLEAGQEKELAANVDALQKRAHEGWRVSRFKLAKGLRWSEVDYPDTVTNLGELVAHLTQKPAEFPPETYGTKDKPNSATLQLLFDYWGNSKARSQISDAHASWQADYRNAPGKLPVRGKDARLCFVLRRVVEVPAKPVSPGAGGLLGPLNVQKCPVDSSFSKVQTYIEALDELSTELDGLRKVSNDAEKERLGLVARLQAVKIIAEEQDPVQGNAGGIHIAKSVGGILPQARTALRTVPTKVTYSDAAIAASIERYLRTGNARTRNVATDTMRAYSELRELLFGATHVEMLVKWCQCNVIAYLRKDELVIAQVGKLTHAMGRALRWLGEAGPAAGTGPTTDDASLISVLDAAPSDRAATAADVKGNTPTAVVLSLVGKEFDDEDELELIPMVGKGSAIATQVVGNLAGPPSLSIALIEGYQTWKYQRLTLAASAQSKAGGVYRGEDFRELAEEIVDRIPGRKLREQVRQALLDRDLDKLEELKSKVGGQHASRAQSSATWNGVICILNVVNAAMTLYDASNDPPDTMLEQFTFSANVVAGGMVVLLGSIELYLQVTGELASATSELLGKLNCVVGLLSALVGICNGIVNLVDAAKKGDRLAVASAVLAIAGNALMAYVCLVGIFGSTPAGWPVAALAIVCLLASQGLTTDGFKKLLQTEANNLCEGLVRWVRRDPIFQAAESTDSSLADAMKQLETDCGNRYLPGITHSEESYARLRLAGLSDAVIESLRCKRTA